MKRQTRLLLLLTAIAISLFPAGCGNANSGASASPEPSQVASSSPSPSPSVPPSTEAPTAGESATASPAPSPSSSSDPVLDRLNAMSLDEKVGQMVIFGLDGTTMGAETQKLIQQDKIGGLILYKNNITSAGQALELLNALKKANRNNPAPLWLSVDQEGGKVSRMPDSYVKIPKAQDIGKTGDAKYAERTGEAIAAEIKSLGFNLDFAPVMDINSNPDNPVIGDRSFGPDAETVIKQGTAVMQGLHAGKVAEVIKHFPGHGDTSVDSHLELPVVNKSLKQLQSFELLPFEAAVKKGTDMVMVAHLLIPKIDSKYPASMSPAIITDLLRGTLQFKGVVITDDMTMGGIVKHFGIAEAAVQSVKAGTDIVLVGHDPVSEAKVLDALKSAVQSGKLSEQAIDEHVYRILQLKQKYALSDKASPSVDVKVVNSKVSGLLKR